MGGENPYLVEYSLARRSAYASIYLLLAPHHIKVNIFPSIFLKLRHAALDDGKFYLINFNF